MNANKSVTTVWPNNDKELSNEMKYNLNPIFLVPSIK